MRQMDTILVAVGVPTKEGAGATPGHSHSVILSERKLDTPEGQHMNENREHEKNLTEALNTKDETNMKTEGEHNAERVQENGWDIPDISGLLDSLSVSESEQKESNFFTCSKGSEGSDRQCMQEEEGQSETDSECVSWEWDTKHWTTEHTSTCHSQRTECLTQDQVAKGKQAFSATLPTRSLHSPVTEHTTTAHIDSDEIKG